MLVPPVLLSIGLLCNILNDKIGKAKPTTQVPMLKLTFRVLKMLAQAILVPIVLVFCVVGICSVIVYPVARVYLLAESFAGLRSVDNRVYKTVEWVEFIPHAG